MSSSRWRASCSSRLRPGWQRCPRRARPSGYGMKCLGVQFRCSVFVSLNLLSVFQLPQGDGIRFQGWFNLILYDFLCLFKPASSMTNGLYQHSCWHDMTVRLDELWLMLLTLMLDIWTSVSLKRCWEAKIPIKSRL